jgi:hypothetical protein
MAKYAYNVEVRMAQVATGDTSQQRARRATYSRVSFAEVKGIVAQFGDHPIKRGDTTPKPGQPFRGEFGKVTEYYGTPVAQATIVTVEPTQIRAS